MKVKKMLFKRILPIFMVALMTFTSIPADIISKATGSNAADMSTVSAANDYGLRDEIQEGTILHCFDWSYNQIKEELPNIAKAGFTSVQTSPAQRNDSFSEPWYMMYQPQNFAITTNPIGSKAELKALCEEADKYGIKIIVDVVANHTRGMEGAGGPVDDNLKNSAFYRTGNRNSGDMSSEDWKNRYLVYSCNIGMRDLVSENADLQKIIAGYITELQGVGVDGIRWDAAKHIQLPSEGSEFWKTVTSQGLYHYGEILDGPCNGGNNNDALMKEYTDYISVTDDVYGGNVLDSLNGGQVPASIGNYSERKVPKNKLVYWAESHDTYANDGEYGKNTSLYNQNVVDRAYAIVAAQDKATSLYYSRPFETRKASIKPGVKGSTHFTSPEVAEVNKFHNALVGEKEYYKQENNVAAVCRESGAVVVKGSGSGQVSITNGGGTTKPGTYKDRITGNTWTVTETTISGEVGSTGIAVFYDAEPITTEKVDATSTTGSNTFATATLDVKLVAKNVSNPTYTTSEGASGSYADGDTITVGSSLAEGESVTVTVKGTGASGEKTKDVTFTKQAKPSYWKYIDGSHDVYILKPSGWGSSLKCYAYVDESSNNGDWPGAAMQSLGEDVYAYDMPDGWTSAKVIFSDGSNQYPASQQPGLDWADGTSMALIDGSWNKVEGATEKGTVTVKYVDETGKEIKTATTMQGKVGDSYSTTAATISGYTLKTTPTNATGTYTATAITVTYVYSEETDDTPKVTSDFADGSAFETENKEITLTLTNADEGTYCVDNGPVKKFTGSAKVKIGQGKIADTDVTVKATATKGTTTKEYTFTYKKKFKDTINEVTIPNAVKASEESLDTPLAAGTNATLASQYKTNSVGVGTKKTITVDKSISDWDSSMLIAQGAANDDPRVYRPNSMYEVPIDEYALYGAYDDNNLYLMWEMTNVQDVVAPNDDYPLTQGTLFLNMNIPFFIAIDTGKSDAIGNKGALQGSGTLWGSGITIENSFNRLIAISTNGANGPFVYGGDSSGLNPVEIYSKAGGGTSGAQKSGIQFGYGQGILSSSVKGINGAYGKNNNRVVGDVCDNSAAWVDFNTVGHNSGKMDFHYEIAIPLSELGITASDVESTGVGALVIATSGKSGMDCLPYDVSMNDQADLDDTAGSQENNSFEKSDEDNITCQFARIGNGTITPPPAEELKLNFGADRSAPQLTSTALTLSAKATGGKSPYTYKYTVNGKEVTGNWTPSEEGEYALACTATDADGKTVVSSKYYTVEKDGENLCKHTNTEVRDAKAATCTEDGYTGDTWCKDCNTKTATGIAIEKLGHQEAVKNQKEATCTEAGYTGDTYCKVCDTTLQTGTEIPAKGHTFDGDSGNAKPATCIEDGYTGDGYCTVCKETVKGETIPATGHKEAVKDKEEATCTNEGYTGDTYCTVCNVVIKEGTTVPKLEHKFDASKRKEGKAATCIEDGCEASEYCTLCNSYVGGAVIPATGHTFGDNAVGKKEPTCTEDGYTGDGTCTVCGTTGLKGTVIPATGHKFDANTVKNQKDPTCTEAGYTGDGTCTVCGQEGVHGTEIPALGHDFSGRIINKREPSCEVAGYTGDTYCVRCREVLEEGTEIPATGHDFSGAVVNKKAATCTENGYTGDTPCVNCSKKHEGEVIPALGHKWNDGEVTKQPTATEKGIKTYTCTVCGETRKEEIAATGENNNNNNNGGNTNGNNNGTNGGNTNGNNNGTNGGNTNGNNNGTNGGNTNGTNNGVIEVPGVGDTVDDATTKATYRVTKDVGSVKEVEYVVADSKTETVEVPASITVNNASYKVTAISNGAFKNNKTLKSVVIGQNVKTIGDNAFKDCTNLTTVVMGANVTTIGNNAFYKCSKLTGVKLSAKTKSIGNYAFYKCTKLTSITIPSKVNKIGKYAFYGCKKLKKITIKTKSLTKKNVGTKAFKGISAKATIKVPSSKLTSYEKLLTDKGVGPKAKIKK